MNMIIKSKKITHILNGVFITILMNLFSIPAQADERETLEQLKATTINLIDLLVQEGVLPKNKADAIVKQATEQAARQVKQSAELDDISNLPNKKEEKSVRVQYVPEHIKAEMRQDIEKEVMEKLNYKGEERLALPAWLDRFSFHGDIRLRGQLDTFSDNNASLADLNNPLRDMNLLNSSENRGRLRTRARFGTDVQINDWLTGGIQFVSGALETPLTPNQTQGMAQGKYTFGLDRTFLKAEVTPWLTLVGGRFANPFLHTDILWDPDLAFDGAVAKFTPQFNNKWSSFITVGAFPLEEIQSSEVNKARDKWLYSLQTGIKWEAPNKSTFKLAAAYHDYKNVEGRLNSVGLTDNSATAPLFRQRGNNTFDINANNTSFGGAQPIIGTASKFEQVNLTGQIDLMNFDPVHMTLTGDYVKNIGFNRSEILARTGNPYDKEVDAYQVRFDLGHNSFNAFNREGALKDVKAHDWMVSFGYKRIEADSVLDAFTDSNFGLGSTNAKGWVLMGNYGIDKNTWLGARYLTSDNISGLPFSVDVLLIDINGRF
jgi:hypothetical protein